VVVLDCFPRRQSEDDDDHDDDQETPRVLPSSFSSSIAFLAKQSEDDDDHEDDHELPRLPVERFLIVVSDEKRSNRERKRAR
jgi:hypothetical protein